MVEGDKADAVEGEDGSLGKGFLHWVAFFGWMGVGYLSWVWLSLQRVFRSKDSLRMSLNGI